MYSNLKYFKLKFVFFNFNFLISIIADELGLKPTQL